jgi:hypothetical protein
MKKLLILLALISFPALADVSFSDTKLNLPIDSKGGYSGTGIEVFPVTKDFQKPPYFIRNSDGSVTEAAPVNGAKTSKNTHYARTEGRQMVGNTEAAWKATQYGLMQNTISVDEVPLVKNNGPGGVVVGQIHGPDDELCRLYYRGGQLSFYDDKAGSSKKETQFILLDKNGKQSAIPLGAKFDYSIEVLNGKLTVSAFYNGTLYQASEIIGPFWLDKKITLYFKWGAYVQVAPVGVDAGSTGTGWGRVTFYNHFITNMPSSLPPVTPPCSCP